MKPKDVKRAVVVGAGVMGSSIALVFARYGIEVDLVDRSDDLLKRALGLIESGLNTLAEHGSISTEEIPAILNRIHPSTDLKGSSKSADFAVEAVNEVEDIKKEVFSRLSESLPDDTVIASNTSGLDIFSFAEVKNPGRLIIAHWFLPAHIIPLVEVVPGENTAQNVVTFTAGLMEMLGKKPIIMKKFIRSFIVNRLQNMLSVAWMELIEGGYVEPEDIDRAVKYSLGVRLPIVGVVQTVDFTGLDLVLDIIKSYGVSNRFIEEKVEGGSLGAKTSRGIYDYGGRSEEEILKKRDLRYLEMFDALNKINAFEPI